MDDTLVMLGSLLSSTLRLTAPLLLAALAGLLAERSGVIDLGLEGKMLASAFAAAAVASVTQSALLGVCAAICVAATMALIHGFACVTHRGDQVICGVALNMVAAGLTVVLGIAWFSTGGQTPTLPPEVRIAPLAPSLTEALGAAQQHGALVGGLLGHGLFSHNALVYLAFASVGGVWFLLARTRLGLRQQGAAYAS